MSRGGRLVAVVNRACSGRADSSRGQDLRSVSAVLAVEAHALVIQKADGPMTRGAIVPPDNGRHRAGPAPGSHLWSVVPCSPRSRRSEIIQAAGVLGTANRGVRPPVADFRAERKVSSFRRPARCGRIPGGRRRGTDSQRQLLLAVTMNVRGKGQWLDREEARRSDGDLGETRARFVQICGPANIMVRAGPDAALKGSSRQ